MISTHAPHAGSDASSSIFVDRSNISTHAPHAGSDFQPRIGITTSLLFQPTLPMRGATKRNEHDRKRIKISTHAPHAGSDLNNSKKAVLMIIIFQPTLPMRGATFTKD